MEPKYLGDDYTVTDSKLTHEDAVEWMRQRWSTEGQPAAEYFAAMAALLRTHSRVVAALDVALKPLNLNRTMYLTLVTLQMANRRTRPLGKLSKQLLVHPTTITMVVDQLESRELVKRVPHASDRRTMLVSLTESGHELVLKANQALADIEFGLSGLSPQVANMLTEVLRQSREAIGDIA
jgi:DNA-binding MarR family transcriptional regulator